MQNRSGKSKLKTISSEQPFNISTVSKENVPDLSSKPADRSTNIGKPQTLDRSRNPRNVDLNPLPGIRSRTTLQPQPAKIPNESNRNSSTSRSIDSQNLSRDFAAEKTMRRSLPGTKQNTEPEQPQSGIPNREIQHLEIQPADRLFDSDKPQTSDKSRGSTNFNFSSLPDMQSSKTSQPQPAKIPDKSNRIVQPSRNNIDSDKDFGTRPARKSLKSDKMNDILPEPQTGQPIFHSPKFYELEKTIKNDEFGKNTISEMILQARIKNELTEFEVKELQEILDPKPKTRRLQPTRIIVGPTEKPLKIKADTITKEDEKIAKNLSPQEAWELKNRAKLIELEQGKLEKIKTELKNLPEDEDTSRKQLEIEEYLAKNKLQEDIKNFQKQMKELKAIEEQDLLDEASRQAAILRLEREEKLAAEKAQPLAESEIRKIVNQYIEDLNTLYKQWKKQNPFGTESDFLDFELDLKNQKPMTKQFTQAIEKLLLDTFTDFDGYNQATKDLIVLKLEQEFFRFDQPRKSELEWNDAQKQYINNRNLQNIKKLEEQTRLKNDASNQAIQLLTSSPEDQKIIEKAWSIEKETSPDLLLKYLKIHKVANLAFKVLSYKTYVDQETFDTYQSNKEELEELVKNQNLSDDEIKRYLTTPPDRWFAEKNNLDGEYIQAISKIKAQLQRSEFINFDDLSLKDQTSMITKIINEIGEAGYKSQASLQERSILKDQQLKQIFNKAQEFKKEGEDNPLLADLYKEKRRAMKAAYDALLKSDSPLKQNELEKQLQSPSIQKQNQIKILKDILSVYNQVAHFIEAEHMKNPSTLVTKITRAHLQEVLNKLNKPDSDPLTNQQMTEFIKMYEDIYSPKK